MPTLVITDNEKADLETIIDSRGLRKLLDAIADICRAKSEHCSANWQDEALAQVWDARADLVANASSEVSRTGNRTI